MVSGSQRVSMNVQTRIKEYQQWKENIGFFYHYVSSMAFTWPLVSVYHFHTLLDQDTNDCSLQVVFTACTDENSFVQTSTISALSKTRIAQAESSYSDFSQPDPVFKQHCQYREGEALYSSARYGELIANYLNSGTLSIYTIDGFDILPKSKIQTDSQGFGICLSKSSLFCSSITGSVKVFDIENQKEQYNYDNGGIACDAIDVAKNSNEFVVGDDLGKLRLCDLRKSKPQLLQKLDYPVSAVCFGRTDKIMFVGEQNGDIHCLDKRKGIYRSFSYHDGAINGFEYNEQYRMLLSYSNDRRVALWKLHGTVKQPWFVHAGHTEKITDATFAENDLLTILSADEDNILQIWSPC